MEIVCEKSQIHNPFSGKDVKPEIRIRFAVPEDAGLVAALGRETFHDAFADHPQMPTEDLNLYLNKAFSVGQIASEIDDPKAFFLLAEVAGETAGYAKLVADARATGVQARNPVKLQRLYSKQKFIGAGLGASLLTACLREADARGHDVIWLSVWEHNPRAQAFYRKWNFEPCSLIDFRLGQSLLTDVVMQREI